MDLDERVRAAIAASGKPHTQIAREAGLAAPTVNRIANGKRRVGASSLRALCRALPRLAQDVAGDLRRAS